MSALEKIVRILEKTEATNGNALAAAFKARKKADIKVLGFGDFSAVVATDEGDTLKIAHISDTGYAQFVSFLKGKSSVLLPKVEQIATQGDWVIYKLERLQELDAVVGEDHAADLGNWAIQYSNARLGVGRANKHMEYKQPDIGQIVNFGNFRGLLNKIIAYNTQEGKGALDLHAANFMVRDGNQLVITDPYAA